MSHIDANIHGNGTVRNTLLPNSTVETKQETKQKQSRSFTMCAQNEIIWEKKERDRERKNQIKRIQNLCISLN